MNGLIHSILSEPLPFEKSEVGKNINYLKSFRTDTFERFSFYMYLNTKVNRASISLNQNKPAHSGIQPYEETSGLREIKFLKTTPSICLNTSGIAIDYKQDARFPLTRNKTLSHPIVVKKRKTKGELNAGKSGKNLYYVKWAGKINTNVALRVIT